MTDKEFREGDSPVSEEVPTAQDEHSDEVSEPQEAVPMSAVLLIKFPDRVEISIDLPWLKTERKPSVAEIRDMASSARDEAQAIITGRKAAQIFAGSIAKAQEETSRIQVPRGSIIRGLPPK